MFGKDMDMFDWIDTMIKNIDRIGYVKFYDIEKGHTKGQNEKDLKVEIKQVAFDLDIYTFIENKMYCYKMVVTDNFKNEIILSDYCLFGMLDSKVEKLKAENEKNKGVF